MHTRRLRNGTVVTVAAGLLILGTAPAFADPTDTPSATPSPSAVPSPEAPKGQQAPSPRTAKADEPAPDLEVRHEFTPPTEQRYIEGEPFTVKVTVTNLGTADATEAKVSFQSKSGAKFAPVTDNWHDLDPGKAGATLKPGEKRDVVFTVTFSEATVATGQIEFAAAAKVDAKPENNKTVLDVPIALPTEKGALRGRLFLDKDKNGFWGPGEDASGATLMVNGPRVKNLVVKTDATGRFTVENLFVDAYIVTAPALTDGWVIKPSSAVIRGTGGTDLQLAADRPLTDGLKVTAKFNEVSYQSGAEASLTLTLANGGSDNLKLVANCDISTEAARKAHLAVNWGDMVPTGPGESVKAGETRTFQVKGTVPAGSLDRGVVYIHCDFRQAGTQYVNGFPQAFAFAKVPGRNGIGNGWFYEDRDGGTSNRYDPGRGEGIKGLVVSLIDPFHGGVVATTTTLENGGFKFENVPAGWYLPAVKGPWKLKFSEFLVIAADDWGTGREIQVVPGSATDPGTAPVPLPRTPPADNDDDENTSNQARALARTGANVIGLTIGGVVVLLLGVGAVVFTRKRRRS